MFQINIIKNGCYDYINLQNKNLSFIFHSLTFYFLHKKNKIQSNPLLKDSHFLLRITVKFATSTEVGIQKQDDILFFLSLFLCFGNVMPEKCY